MASKNHARQAPKGGRPLLRRAPWTDEFQEPGHSQVHSIPARRVMRKAQCVETIDELLTLDSNVAVNHPLSDPGCMRGVTLIQRPPIGDSGSDAGTSGNGRSIGSVHTSDSNASYRQALEEDSEGKLDLPPYPPPSYYSPPSPIPEPSRPSRSRQRGPSTANHSSSSTRSLHSFDRRQAHRFQLPRADSPLRQFVTADDAESLGTDQSDQSMYHEEGESSFAADDHIPDFDDVVENSVSHAQVQTSVTAGAESSSAVATPEEPAGLLGKVANFFTGKPKSSKKQAQKLSPRKKGKSPSPQLEVAVKTSSESRTVNRESWVTEGMARNLPINENPPTRPSFEMRLGLLGRSSGDSSRSGLITPYDVPPPPPPPSKASSEKSRLMASSSSSSSSSLARAAPTDEQSCEVNGPFPRSPPATPPPYSRRRSPPRSDEKRRYKRRPEAMDRKREARTASPAPSHTIPPGTEGARPELSSTPPPAVAGPAVAGPAVAGPAVAGPAVAGPSVAGPSVAGPPVAGPAVAGPAVAGPAVAGNTDTLDTLPNITLTRQDLSSLLSGRPRGRQNGVIAVLLLLEDPQSEELEASATQGPA